MPDYSSNGLETFTLNKSTTWRDGNDVIELPAPSLNITLYGFWENGTDMTSGPLYYKSYWQRGAYTNGGRQGEVYTASYILSHGSCQPEESYQWGFSYIFLFMMSIFNFVWSCIMVGMWLDTRRGSRMYKSGRRPGLLRSIMDISGAMQAEIGEDADALDEEELRRRLRTGGGRLVVPKDELRVARTESAMEGVEKRGRWKSLTKGSTF
jgi:hypothetical protein